MNGSKISSAWVTTITAGSTVVPFVGGTIADSVALGGFLVLISFMFSFLCSMPTFIALLIAESVTAKKDFKTRMKYITMVHFIMFLLTITVGYILSGEVAFVLVVCYYAVIAIVVWFLMFRKEWNS